MKNSTNILKANNDSEMCKMDMNTEHNFVYSIQRLLPQLIRGDRVPCFYRVQYTANDSGLIRRTCMALTRVENTPL
jgi:hypothetical protein